MILVIGGTGQLGGGVVRLLRRRGQSVRCLVRPGTDHGRLREESVEVVTGDLANPATLSGACEGADAVVATATVIGRRLAGARRPSIRAVDQIGMSALIDVAEAASVGRFVYVSMAGADANLGTPLERAKLATEQRLGGSSMRSVIVRPDAFQDIHLTPLGRFDIARGKVAVFGRGDTKRRWVSTDDVASLVYAVAVERDPPAMVEFGGPEALSRNEAIAIAEQVTGRSIKRQRIPRPLARLAMRVLDHPNDALASVFGAGLLQDLVASNWDDAPLKERGIRAKPASQFIREQAQRLSEA